MAEYRFERETRTAYSESYSIWDDEKPAGRVDIHYTPGAVYATICLNEGAGEEAVQEVIGAVDDELVMTADPYREDLIATVWAGKELGVYSDEDLAGFDEEFGDETEGNGSRP